MCQFDPGSPVTTEGGPKAEHHPTGLVERDLVVRLLGAGPAGASKTLVLQMPDSLAERLRETIRHSPRLGGVVLEMYRQDRFRQDLVYEQAVEIVALEERLQDLDQLLAAAASRRSSHTVRCAQCGVPLFAGARYCPSCAAEQAE